MRIRTRFRLRRWREGKVRPVQGNSPHDRLVSRWVFLIVKGASATIPSPPLRCRPMNSRAPGNAFLRHGRNLSVRCRDKPKPGRGATASRRQPPIQARERVGRNTLSSSFQMSSGRLFLDRVARQHCPSPLHRQPDHKTVDRGDERNIIER
jgi:hypothetical protein